MTAVATQSQFFKGIVSYGALGVIPTLAGVTLNVPENYAIPPIIGNYVQFSFGQGFINPSLEVDFVFRDVAGELMTPTSGNFTAPTSFFDYAHLRSNDSAYDLASIGNITIQPTGTADAFVMTGAKISAYSMSCSKGGEISLHVSFVGTGLATLSTALVATAWSNANVLRFKNVNFASPMDNQVWEFGYSYSNNVSPDMCLNGSEFPAAQNGGMPTANFNMSTQIKTVNRPDNGTFPVPGSLATISFTIAGTYATLTMLGPNPINNVKRNRTIQAPRIMQAYAATLLGGTGFGLPATVVIA